MTKLLTIKASQPKVETFEEWYAYISQGWARR